MMEKYDGVRVFWDGHVLQAKGKLIDVPKSFVLPSLPFEGVLWYDTTHHWLTK
jgi:hypothetical protein